MNERAYRDFFFSDEKAPDPLKGRSYTKTELDCDGPFGSAAIGQLNFLLNFQPKVFCYEGS